MISKFKSFINTRILRTHNFLAINIKPIFNFQKSTQFTEFYVNGIVHIKYAAGMQMRSTATTILSSFVLTGVENNVYSCGDLKINTT